MADKATVGDEAAGTSSQESPAPADTAPPWDLYTGRQRALFLTILFLMATSNYIDRHILTVLLEPIKTEFQVSDTLLGLLTGITFALFYATLGIPIARMADRGNRVTIISVCLALWSAMTAACGLAQTFWQLALARVGVAIGEAGALPPGQSLIADYFPPHQRARAIAIFMASGSVGYLVGVTAGSAIAAAYGWRAAFLVMGLPGLLLALATWLLLKEPRLRAGFRPPPDIGESFLETLRVLWRKPSFVWLTTAMVLYFMYAYGVMIFVVSFMVRVLGVPLGQAGTLFGAAGTVALIVGSIGGGYLIDRLGRKDLRWLAWAPAAVLAGALPLYLLAFLSSDVWVFIGLIGVAGLAINAGLPAFFSILHSVCGSARRAMAVAIVFFFANLIGLGLGPVITGALSDLFTGWYGVEGLRYALLVMVFILLPAAVASYAIAGRIRQDQAA